MPENAAPMVDFNHTIVELVGNEVMVGCRGGDGTSQQNRDQSGGEYDLDGKFHGASLLWRRVLGREKPQPSSQKLRLQNLNCGRCRVVNKLSLFCHSMRKGWSQCEAEWPLSLQILVFRLGFVEEGDVGVGVFPGS